MVLLCDVCAADSRPRASSMAHPTSPLSCTPGPWDRVSFRSFQLSIGAGNTRTHTTPEPSPRAPVAAMSMCCDHSGSPKLYGVDWLSVFKTAAQGGPGLPWRSDFSAEGTNPVVCRLRPACHCSWPCSVRFHLMKGFWGLREKRHLEVHRLFDKKAAQLRGC